MDMASKQQNGLFVDGNKLTDKRLKKESRTQEEEERLEREHFRRILNAFKYYKTFSLQKVTKTEQYLDTLPEKHKKLLSSYSKHLKNVQEAIDCNNEVIKGIIQDVAYMFENVDHSADATMKDITDGPYASLMDMEKVQSTIKQFARDWSEYGAEERKSCYQPIIDEIEKEFYNRNRSEISVLVPGAGLGRLAFEIAKCGFICQGNEFSLFMLFASNFVLNKCCGVNANKIYPWVHQSCNNVSSGDQISYVEFPDINTSDLPADSKFSMAAGDFLEVYTESEQWDCVTTCFFIDTANNIIAYIEAIWNILKQGGVWINLGPLLYHYADMANENSIEPSYEDVKNIIRNLGFVFKKEKTHVHTTYSQNKRSMLRYEFDSIFFVCQKPTSEMEEAMNIS